MNFSIWMLTSERLSRGVVKRLLNERRRRPSLGGVRSFVFKSFVVGCYRGIAPESVCLGSQLSGMRKRLIIDVFILGF